MADISHVWGSDIALGPTGDLALVTGLEEGRQRVLRRLMTAIHNDIFNLDYGSGLPGMVGNPADPGGIEGIVREQIAMESAVSTDPAPSVAVTSDGAGSVLLAIAYTDAGTGVAVAIGPDDLPLGAT